jgi:hypothetical protein
MCRIKWEQVLRQRWSTEEEKEEEWESQTVMIVKKDQKKRWNSRDFYYELSAKDLPKKNL